MEISRRKFFAKTATSAAAAAAVAEQDLSGQITGKHPVIICAANGYAYLDRAWAALQGGADTLDAAIEVVTGPEDDPKDDSVGLGGLPNEEGVVELDSCCMHGPTHRAGSVGGCRNIKNVSKVAKAVMEHTGHVMLVGEGAEKFAVSMGFARENLLTEHSRKVWALWREVHSNQDWWGPQIGAPNWVAPVGETSPTADNRMDRLVQMAANLGIAEDQRLDAVRKVLVPPTGTIHCSVANAKGEVSGITTTSGLAWKIPGRVGDSATIGAGCYTDPDVGSAGATGSGEENIKVAGAHTIIEAMRRGLEPHEAAMEALKRITRFHNDDQNQLRFIGMIYYVLRKDGAYAGVSLWSGKPGHPPKFAVHDGTKRLESCTYLLEGEGRGWPPIPSAPW
jgi:N4-(beta-N-acetylglucosaminyl)-L-asparaginase